MENTWPILVLLTFNVPAVRSATTVRGGEGDVAGGEGDCKEKPEAKTGNYVKKSFHTMSKINSNKSCKFLMKL